ncbi:MAG: hypothetical protein U0T07_06760 [Chitinophagales bacterium]
MKIKSSSNKNNVVSEKTASSKSNYLDVKWPYFLLMILAGLVYGWTYTFEYNLDDRISINNLWFVGYQFSDIITIFKQNYAGMDYRPIPILTFWIERALFGEENASMSHLINAILFGGILLCIYRLSLLIKFYEQEVTLFYIALLTAIIFLVHPNHVSVVANIKSRDSLLSMLFGLLYAINFIQFYDTQKWWRIFTIALFISLAVLSKLDAYSLIFLPLLIIMFYRKFEKNKWLKFIVFAVFCVLLFSLVRTKLMENLMVNDFVKSNFIDISRNPLFVYDTFYNKCAMALTSLFYYIKFLFIPNGYFFYFGYNQVPLSALFSPLNVIALLVSILLLLFSVYYFKKDKIFLFSLIFFFMAIAYALNLIDIVAGIVMDRYNFIASLGFCWALASIIITVHQKAQTPIFKYSLWIIVPIYLCFTIYRTSAWKNEETLYNRDIENLSNSFIANRLIAGYYVDKALARSYSKFNNDTLANQYIATGDKYANIALNIFDKSAEIWQVKGVIDLYNGKDSAGLLKFKTAMNIDSNYLSPINYIGVAYRNLNNYDSAYYYFNWVMQKETFYNYSADNLINLLLTRKEYNKADSILQYLTKRFPNDARLIYKKQEFNKLYTTFN